LAAGWTALGARSALCRRFVGAGLAGWGECAGGEPFYGFPQVFLFWPVVAAATP
jgi:hypothetical protein